MTTNKNFRFHYLWISVALLFSAFPGITTANANQAIELAVIVAQSGKAEAYGRPAVQGARLALAEINNMGGLLGQPLALVFLDNQSTALNAKQMARQAIERDVIAVIGDIWSTHSMAVAPLLQKAGIPMISPGSTAPEVTRVGPYIFRTCYRDDFQGELMAGFALQAVGAQTAAVITNISETYSQTLAEYFVAAFSQKGGRVVYQGCYKGNAIDFKKIITPLKVMTPDVIFIPGYARDSGLLIKQASGLGVQSTFLGGDAWERSIADYAGGALEGSYFSTHWHPGAPYQRSRTFIARFYEAFGNQEISVIAPLTYDAVLILADAIRRAKSLDRQLIRNALAATKQFQGATGVITFDTNGDPVKKSASILKFEKGQWLFHKTFEP